MLLIGSIALKYHLRGLDREARDADLIGTAEELRMLIAELKRQHSRVRVEPFTKNKTVIFTDKMIYEFEIAWPGSTGEQLSAPYFIDPISGERRTAGYRPVCGFGFIGMDDLETSLGAGDAPYNVKKMLSLCMASLDHLYTLKMSHRYLKNSPHFLKTMRDIQKMRAAGAKIWDETWLKEREIETYAYKHPKLNVMKNNFFGGDGVKYEYDHDDIHKSMAHYYDHSDSNVMVSSLPVKFVPNPAVPRPAYTLYMRDGAEVQCSKEKFFAANEMVRLYGVLEEAQVLALERSQIPFKGQVDPRKSFEMALMKVCTSITSGWFREFAWENYDRVLSMYDPQYVEKFLADVDGGKVKRLDKTNEGDSK